MLYTILFINTFYCQFKNRLLRQQEPAIEYVSEDNTLQ
nr:MAG TPA: hypothetical protein [Caudoviricetes sp.]